MTPEEFSAWVERHGGTAKVAALFGLTTSQVSSYRTGRRNLGYKMMRRIEEIESGTSETMLSKTPSSPNVRIIDDSETVLITLYERRVNAGRGIDLDNDGVMYVKELRSAIRHPDKTFAVQVSGDSMQGYGITEDSVVTCERVDHGDIAQYTNRVVLAGYDGAAFIKLLVHEDGEYRLRSVSYPPGKYEDMVLDDVHTWQVFAVMLHFTTRG